MHPSQNISFTAALVYVVVALIVGLGLGFLYADGSIGTPVSQSQAPEGVDFSPVWRAWNIIDEKFVPATVSTTTPVATSTEKLAEERVWGMIEGLAASLNDPYTFFLPPAENQQFADDLSGQFEGVGMEIAVRDQVLTIVTPLKGTPAERAGLKSGDKILRIDGEETRGIDVGAAIKKIRGPKGTTVTLFISRKEWNTPREIKVVRDVINVPTIITELRDDGVFLIELRSFTANSPQLFREALREFIESGSTRLVLDIRGNPGGYLEAAVDMASWFIPAGRPVVTEDYAGHANNIVHRSAGYNVFNDNLKMVILVDQGSASASEILAGALRHYNIAQLVGQPTFGKGSVQELVDITPDTALKITVAHWLTPSGQQIPLTGIVPDVEVERTDADFEAGKDPQFDRAIEIVKSL